MELIQLWAFDSGLILRLIVCVWRNIYVRYVLEGNFKFSSLVNLLYNGVVLLWTFSQDCFPTCCVIVSWVLFDLTIWEYSYCGTQKELSVLWLYCWIPTERLITLLNENSNILKVVYEPGDMVLSMTKYTNMFMGSKKSFGKKKTNDLQTPHHRYGWWQLFGLLGYVLEFVCCYWLLVMFL